MEDLIVPLRPLLWDLSLEPVIIKLMKSHHKLFQGKGTVVRSYSSSWILFFFFAGAPYKLLEGAVGGERCIIIFLPVSLLGKGKVYQLVLMKKRVLWYRRTASTVPITKA